MQKVTICYTEEDIAETELSDAAWDVPESVCIDQYWNGIHAPEGRHSSAKLLWSDHSLQVRFEAKYAEPFVIADDPDLSTKTIGLWDRDVVEIFVAPDRNEPRKYFEFEAAPTGEWLDVALDSTSGKRVSDWDYDSGMQTASKIEYGDITTVIKIPWTAFGKKPEPGDVWLGNILRCVGKDPDRGYLAWSPTMTEEPNFHVPKRFGELHFVK